MKRLLTTTAVLMSLSGAALAESHATADSTMSNDNSVTGASATENTTSTATDNGTMTNETAMETNAMEDGAAFGTVIAQEQDFYASDLIGMRIYNVEAEMDTNATVADGAETEWDDIGEINDLIVTADGKVSAVILGVGGFLGIGERDVSVSMDAITIVAEEGDSDDRFLVVKTSKEELENAPAYERESM